MREPGSKLIDLNTLDQYRIKKGPVIKHWGGWAGDDTCGAFLLPIKGKIRGLSTRHVYHNIRAIISGSEGWDHVSVSLPTRCPTWEEMEAVKHMVFEPDTICWQLHVPAANHINLHPFCLHIWQAHAFSIPMPPPHFVG